jgi:transketolase
MTLPMGRPMREVFGETVAALADEDPRIVMLDGDVGSSTKADIFEKAHPDRYLQMGIAEQNMLGVAAGLATMGLVPFVSTFVSFAVVRPLDQIRVLIAQTGLNVKITPGYAGLFTGMTGMSHIIVDDMAIMRAMPGMVTVSPADDIEAAQVLRWAAAYQGPCYVRLVRDPTQRLFDESYRFALGKAAVVREGRDVSLISTGAQTPRTVDAAELLAARGIEAHVLHVPTIKPLDEGAIVAAAERTGRVITVEEHTVIGGLGGAVAETLGQHLPTRVDRIGLRDLYPESGPNEALLDIYGLSAERVAEQVAGLLDAGVTADASPAAGSVAATRYGAPSASGAGASSVQLARR